MNPGSLIVWLVAAIIAVILIIFLARVAGVAL